MDGQKDFFSVYFAGELFTHKDLAGNAMLAEAIYARSGGGFRCALPQNFEQRKSQPKGIRDEDILSLLECDLALFNYDGQELDSGTVVEFMFAKFADIPALVVRSDFRGGGDCSSDPQPLPWNLMASFYPRTETLLIDSARLYKDSVREYYAREDSTYSSSSSGFEWAKIAVEKMAGEIVAALGRLAALPPLMGRVGATEIYEWLAKMPDFSDPSARGRIMAALEKKCAKNLL